MESGCEIDRVGWGGRAGEPVFIGGRREGMREKVLKYVEGRIDAYLTNE